jgi:hypothetical protein
MSKKYDRKVWDKYEDRHAVVDVYRVLDAFGVTCPATAHAIKKLLCAGIRGHKDMEQDLNEAAQSIEEARAMLKQKRRAAKGATQPEPTPEPQSQQLPHAFKPGDEVMCLSTGGYTQAVGPMIDQVIESGECGFVAEVLNNCVVVRFEKPSRLVRMPLTHIDKLVKRGAANG